MTKIVLSVILFLVAAFSFFASVRAFIEKGFLLNNAFIYASKKEREQMNKKPYYRQSAIAFLLVGLIFLLNALDVLLDIAWAFPVVIVIVIATLVYAVVSSILIEKNK